MTTETSATPLTRLSEEEQMFQGAVRDFPEQEIRPRVDAMERAAKIDPALIPKFFELGLMGIETPEEHGGSGGSLFMTVLAEAARLMVYNAARLEDAREPYTKEAAMAKLFASQVAERVTSLCVELFGGYGYTRSTRSRSSTGRQDRNDLRRNEQYAAEYDSQDDPEVTASGPMCSYRGINSTPSKDGS